MASATLAYRSRALWRFSRWDALLVALAAVHAGALLAWPSAPLIAVGVWWNSNTIAHNFIHRPFFRSSALNRTFSAALSVLLGIPQTLWRDRHLAHHAGVDARLRVSRQLAWETTLVMALWTWLAWSHARFFLLAYVPGYLLGLGLCALQGYWEHAAGEVTSNYGRLYNFLCFNDGFHAEHHADPGCHWSMLAGSGGPASPWPALLRWLEVPPLETLERMVLRSPRLQRFVLRIHRKALHTLLAQLPPVRHAAIVGGGLFPRTALILRELLPAARITIIDGNRRNIETARGFFDGEIDCRHQWYVPDDGGEFDLTVIPLCLKGDRAALYRHPPAGAVLVHDWIWRRRGPSAVVSPLLLKRINLVMP